VTAVAFPASWRWWLEPELSDAARDEGDDRVRHLATRVQEELGGAWEVLYASGGGLALGSTASQLDARRLTIGQ
jgi:hypothetical protein